MAEHLDRFIWVFKQECFIPHKIFHFEEQDAPEDIAIITNEIIPIKADILISETPPSFKFSLRFKTVYDFVDRNDGKALEASRERFKKFRDKGYNMHYEN